MSGPRGVKWGDLPEEQVEQLRKNNRRRRKLAQIGRPCLVPSGPAMAHVRLLHDEYGMPFREIAKQAPRHEGRPLGQSTVSDLYRGKRPPGKGGGDIPKIPRTTHDRVLAVEVPATPMLSAANVDATGTRRRIQALAYAGFGSRFVSEYLGHTDWNMIWRLSVGKTTSHHNCRSVFASTRELISDLYDKVIDADPLDYGVTPIGAGKARAMAVRHGFAPAHCWDDDTIDDPDAIPEWTGACGTVHGRTIHEREGIPVCEPCRSAKADRARELRHDFDRERLVELLAERRLSHAKFAESMDCTTDAVASWVNGRRKPKPEQLQRMADELGVTVEELG